MLTPPQSLWWSTLDSPVTPRPALSGHLDVDVAIVGGGFTGLWTARELKRRDPALRIAVLEKSVCGFGASGRNGGWASALYPLSDAGLIKRYGMAAFLHQRRVLQQAVTTLGSRLAEDGINADFVQGGTLTFARNEVQVARLKNAVRESVEHGGSTDDLVWLDPTALADRAVVSGALGATFSPHCARIHPARLVRGLADVVASLGVQIFEDSTVTRIMPGTRGRQPQVVTVSGSVHADFVVQATEGFSSSFHGQRRDVAPVYSLMIATEPQGDEFWSEVGFSGYETFADDRNLIIYAQRTSDGRIAFGGRGAPYHFGSTVEERFDANKKVFVELERTLRELFPTLRGAVSHTWGGPLGMTRDLSPFVRVDYDKGIASAGGYTGDGVVLSHVAATALADLLTQPDTETDFTQLTFVQHPKKKWEFEPFRWLGVNAALGLAHWSDRVEEKHATESRASRLLNRLFD